MGLVYFDSKEAILMKEPFSLENITARASLDSQMITNTKEILQKAHMTDKGDSYGRMELLLFAVFRKASESNGSSSKIAEKSIKLIVSKQKEVQRSKDGSNTAPFQR